MQHHFNPSKLFAPWISTEKSIRDRESHNQRRRRREKEIQVKIGHGGTLDPLATGVLITGVGKGTKALQNFLLCSKAYEAVVLFGASTDTYDRVGKILKRAPYEHITKDMVEEALKQYRGKFMQLPPLFSALKMNGKPLYEYAREGKAIPKEIERRPVEVLELEMLEWMEGGTHNHKAPTEDAGYAEINIANKLWKQEGALPASTETESEETLDNFESKKRKLSDAQDDLVFEKPPSKHRKSVSSQDTTMSGGLPPPSSDLVSTSEAKTQDSAPPVKGPPAVRLRMTVTSGFYVRSLAHDLGAAVGSAALMAELERTRQAEFEVGKNVLEYGDLAKGEDVWGPKVEAMLDDWYEKENSSKKDGQSSKKDESATKGEAVKVEPAITQSFNDETVKMEAVRDKLLEKTPLPHTDGVADVAADPAKPVAL
jgi:tRNA pseudouridine55 synthase